MNRTAFVMSLGFGVLVLTAQHAFSQGRITGALQQLEETSGETRCSASPTRDDRLFKAFAADPSGTWRIMRTTPDGASRVVASGVALGRMARLAGASA